MRPVDKGTNSAVFTHWREARDPLIDRIGNFCSYCECRLLQPDVEHKEPKADDKYPDRALNWDNYLLSCGYCNSLKQTKDTRQNHVYFPDEKNTAWAFVYIPGGGVRVNPVLSPDEKSVAKATIDWMLELNRPIDTNGNRDLRWQRRLDVWREARESLVSLQECPNDAMRARIVSCALGWGCYSVWMTVFADDADMRRRFRVSFKGVRESCYTSTSDVIADIDF